MKEKNIFYGLIILYVLVFIPYTLFKGYYEFFYYALISTIVMLLLARFFEKNLPFSVLLVIYFLILMPHMLCGIVYINGTRLYDLWIIPNHFKMDNLVHFTGIFIITIASYYLFSKYFNKKIKKYIFALFLVLVGCGIGTFVEMDEFVSILIYPPSAVGVGDYTNNAWDLVYNLFGAIAGSLFILCKKTKIKR